MQRRFSKHYELTTARDQIHKITWPTRGRLSHVAKKLVQLDKDKTSTPITYNIYMEKFLKHRKPVQCTASPVYFSL
jgi:hypothetical protein